MPETNRLILIPLTYQQLLMYARCDNSLERELNLNDSSRIIEADLKEALEQTILPNVADKSKDYLYSTIWTAISKAENKMVGDLCIYGEPNEKGKIEIGYGIYKEFRNRGFMTEIVQGIIEWAKTQPTVKSITASTHKTNLASFRVLEKNGFVNNGESGDLFHWILPVD
jgi:[ribosomal protein S5]-alanine N-acetyltransferase